MDIKNKNVITKEFWQKLWSILQPFQKKMIWLFTMISIFELLKLINPYFMKLIIDLLTGQKDIEFLKLISFVCLMLATDVFVTLIHYFKDKKIFDFLILIEYSLPIDLQKKLVSLSLGYHERENTGNKIMKVQRGIDRLTELLANASWEFFPTITQILFTFFSMLYFSWQVSLVFIAFVPIFIVITLKMNKITNPLRTRRHEEYENAAGILGQSIINIYTVQSFVQEKNETKKYQDIRNKIAIMENTEWPVVLNYNLLRSIVVDLGRVSVILLSAYFAWQKTITVGSLVFFITLSETAYHALFRLSRTYDRLIENSTGVERITSLLSEKSSLTNKQNAQNITIKGEIIFDNVSFAYHKESRFRALENINLKISPGETVALVGPSGGGKSTIVKLVYRHYDVTTGKILIDGQNIKDYDIYNYRSQLAIVPQDVEIFNTSLRENIAYGRPEATQTEIEEAAKIANIDFINSLENGYDTLVGERGIKLSGGQKQRVGIARAILSNPKILIFDEATSNLDTHSEKLIQKSIEKISRKQTMVIIAHRLSTVINADKIFVVKDGRIAEAGSHEELLKNKNGIYTDLLRLQAIGELK
ncbi:ABC transporter ATP-binding protein [Candidatus Kuenenbacteria bacterium]|nr:ABC transporter ATP-binding protein [Candidatus Kuenenbacteria bacterium]